MPAALTNIWVEASKGTSRSYSITLSPVPSITNILVPSFENAMPVGEGLSPDTGVASTKDRVEASNGADRLYSFTSSPIAPSMNILVPLLENAMPVGKVSCDDMEVASTKDRVEASKGVDRLYSFTSSPEPPTTNILVPSLENAMPRGLSSCADMEVASTKDRVEASKVPTMGLPDSSRTAPGSIVSSGVASPASAARCDGVRANDTVAPSADGVKLACTQGYAVCVIPRLPYVHPGRDDVCRIYRF